MTVPAATVCMCGHLHQAHRFWPADGQCHSPACSCPVFESEEPSVQLALVVYEADTFATVIA